MKDNKISLVPTNIITGFLGVGKTSAILHLLKNKPANERWAVLVNEFGEIGVDGSLFEGQKDSQPGIFISEVPGGCMCCAAGLPMRVALNQLLTKAKPDRLLIEPTGLGHPIEVLQTLQQTAYQGVLDIQRIVTLVDARKLADKRYTNHEIFNQQIAIADIIIGNKQDLYEPNDEQQLLQFIERNASSAKKVIFSEQGHIDAELLKGKPQANADDAHHHHHHKNDKPLINDIEIPACGYLTAINQGEGFQSIGWRFAPNKIFNRKKLLQWLATINAERIKGVFITSDGIFGYNIVDDLIEEMELDECAESKLEIICDKNDKEFEQQLLACVE